MKQGDRIQMIDTKVITRGWHKLPPIIVPTGIMGTIEKVSKDWRGVPFCWITFDDGFYGGIENTYFKIMQAQIDLKSLVEAVANGLLKANNTVTTLEVKTELRIQHPAFYWTQKIVSDLMDQLYNEGKYTFKDTGVFRVYSLPGAVAPVVPAVAKVKNTLTRKKALEMMKNNKGHFFTVVFTKQDGTERTMNCQYLKDQGNIELGYVKVKEASKAKAGVNAIRNVNLQTLKSIKIAGNSYKVK